MIKMLLFKTLAVLTLLACALGASADDRVTFSSGGIYYQLTIYNDGSGVLSVQNNGSFNTYSGVVHIPDSVYYNGTWYPVTGVGYQAFKNSTGLTAVTIPEGVTMLLNESFAGCTSLTSITLPSTMSSIYNNAFAGCTNLTSITCMRETAQSFNANNFDASTYANATLNVPPGSKSSYQSTSAWSRFSNIQEINKFVVDGIYYTVTSGNNVSVTYRDTGYSSYSGVVKVPATVTYRGVTYNVTAVGESAFRECQSGLELDVTLPNTVTTIGTMAFYASNMIFIEMGSKLSSIGENAFTGGTENTLNLILCHAMYTPSISSNTFAQETVDYAYLLIPQLAIDRYKTARNWSNFDPGHLFSLYDFEVDGIYYGINSYLNTVEVSAFALHADTASLFSAYSTLERVVIPPTVTYENVEYTVNAIGTYAFWGWSTKEVTLPNTIKTIEKSAFRRAFNLEKINFAEGVTRIRRLAFWGCELLDTIDIPNSVKVIETGAFYECTGLQNLTVGAGVEQIGYSAFRGCPNLADVTSYALVPPGPYEPDRTEMFDEETYANATLHVPYSAIPAYQNAIEWEKFNHVVGMHTLDEALNVPGGNIHFTESDYPWAILSDGNRLYAQSTNAGVHSSSSTLSTTVRVSEPSILSFDFKAWGESDPESHTAYDECVFMVNGYSIFRYGARDNDWETFTYELNPNVPYQLRWFYHKDVSDNGVGDYFALDNIKIAPKTMRGDVDGDGDVGVADVTTLIDYLLTGNETGVNLAAANVDGDSTVGVADVTALIDYILTGSW